MVLLNGSENGRLICPRGRTYYWLDGALEVHAVSDGYVSVTPIHLDLTAYDHLKTFRILEKTF